MTENRTSTDPIAAASAGGASVEHGADPNLDRLNLEQALLDFEVANRRVIDLARRVASLQRELLETRNELALKSQQLDAMQRIAARLRTSRLFPIAVLRSVGEGLAPMSGRARVLLAITVYNGRAFVGDAVRSATTISTEHHDVDVLVLDDHSPEPGWSEELAALCADLGVRYYCTPRNLGIPRNVNLGLLAAQAEGYTHLVIANSDVLFPSNLIDAMVPACDADDSIASVTAWSNNASIYSLPNDDPVAFLGHQETVDWLSVTLNDAYGAEVFDAPAGISFCIMIPLWAIAEVGLMDPVFGRGYCEETDWSRRSLALGYRCTVAKGVFVYHAGKGSNESAGLVRPGATTVDEHELIIDMRYPEFREEVGRYVASGAVGEHHDEALYEICQAAARQRGYSVEVAYLASGGSRGGTPTVVIDPSERAPIVCHYLGFRADLEVPGEIEAADVALRVREFGGGAPAGVNLLDRGPRTQHLLDAFGGRQTVRPVYPSRV